MLTGAVCGRSNGLTYFHRLWNLLGIFLARKNQKNSFHQRLTDGLAFHILKIFPIYGGGPPESIKLTNFPTCH